MMSRINIFLKNPLDQTGYIMILRHGIRMLRGWIHVFKDRFKCPKTPYIHHDKEYCIYNWSGSFWVESYIWNLWPFLLSQSWIQYCFCSSTICFHEFGNHQLMWKLKYFRSFWHSLSHSHFRALLVYHCEYTWLFCLFSLFFSIFCFVYFLIFSTSCLADTIEHIILHNLLSLKWDIYYLLLIVF